MSKVIELDGYEFTIKDKPSRFRRKKDRCLHRRPILDDNGMTIHCQDCGDQLDAYWLVKEMLDCYTRRMDELKKKTADIEKARTEIEKDFLPIKVLRDVQSAWRGKRKMAVCCPHCNIGIMPEDGLGRSKVSPKYNLVLKRERDKKSKAQFAN